MKLIHAPAELEISGPEELSITIGNFDGFHLGHQAVVAELTTVAQARSGVPMAVTFDPHPEAIVAPRHTPSLLTTTDEKAILMSESGLESLLVVDFTENVAALDPWGFLSWIGVGPGSHLCLGYDFHMGHGRSGDIECLSRLGRDIGFGLDVVPAVLHDGSPISSSRVRDGLAAGDVESGGAMLGRPYSLRGIVVQGDGAGRSLNSPTANLELPERKMLPGDGVYFVRASSLEGRPGLLYVGTRPTMGAGPRRAEVHLLDFEGEIYGTLLSLDVIRRLRDDSAFATRDELAAQIRADVDRARRLASEPAA